VAAAAVPSAVTPPPRTTMISGAAARSIGASIARTIADPGGIVHDQDGGDAVTAAVLDLSALHHRDRRG